MQLDAARLQRILPQRWPFLLLDRVTDLAPRRSARGLKCISASDPCFQGQGTSHVPIYPGVMVLESMSQLLAVLAFASEPYDTNQKVFFNLGFDGVKFRRPVTPGDRLVIDLTITQHRSNIWRAHAEASVEGQLCVQAEVLAALSDHDQLPTP